MRLPPHSRMLITINRNVTVSPSRKSRPTPLDQEEEMAQDDIDKVYQLHTKFMDAMVNQDVDFLMSLFTEDAMIMAPGAATQ